MIHTSPSHSTRRKALPAAWLALALMATTGCGTGGDGPLDGGGDPDPATLPDDFSVGVALHGVSIGAAGSVRTWGENAFGQLGNGTTTSTSTPAEVAGIATAVQVEAGLDFTLAILADGTLQSWGDNTHGQLGDNSTTASLTPTVALLTDVADVNVFGTAQTVLAQTGDGKVWAWGRNDLGQIGNGTTTDVLAPVEIVAVAGALDVCAGEFHSLAVLADGSVRAWGLNINGQLGNGTTTSSTTPVVVTGLSTAKAVACGGSFSLALLANGTVVAWGENGFGALGNGNTTDSSTPVAVTGLTGVTQIDATFDSAIALKSDGTVWTWGGGGSGQLGNGTSTPAQSSPVQVTALSGETVVDIDGGESAVLVITADGSRHAWGLNTTGVLGNGSTTNSSTPVTVTPF